MRKLIHNIFRVGGIVPMPVGAVTNELLRSRGGYDWAFRVEPDGWRFPYRDGFLDGVMVLARGEVRPDIGSIFFPVPITNGVSLLPEAKWGLLPHAESRRRGEGSVFWHGTTVNGSLLLTWENALVGRNLNAPTNMQMELCRDGSFTWRTDDASQLYLPVFPFDWDGDGLENSVDPEPLVANPVDAHGTNSEWYDIVCSNVFTQVEEPGAVLLQTIAGDEIYFRTNANDRAYYFVDAVAELGPVPIFFTADGVSDLGDPIVVALADATNRVPLLLGATYSVTSAVPFSVYTPTNEVVEITTNSPCDYVIRRPLSIAYNAAGDDENGRFSINEDGRLGGNVYSTGECCCTLAAAGLPCGGSGCSCNGCTNTYYYGYCGYSLSLGTWSCGCYYVTPPPPSTPAGASFSITFSAKAVIFEDGYYNSQDEQVGRQSSQTILTISAEGGQYGGSFTLTKVQGLDKLCTHGGGSILPQMSDIVAPGQSYVRSYVCEGLSASGSENDIEIEGTFIEGNTDAELKSEDKMTAVKLELEAVYVAPENSFQRRHVYGVGEKVTFKVTPAFTDVKIKAVKGDTGDFQTRYDTFNGESEVDGSATRTYTCPIASTYTPNITVSYKGIVHRPEMAIVEPQLIVTSSATSSGWFWPGQVAIGCLHTENYIGPMNVSFKGIKVAEIPCEDIIPPEGWFASTNYTGRLSHDRDAGAGDLHSIGEGNFWMPDDAGRDIPFNNWFAGRLVWKIPIGWKRMLFDGDDSVVTREMDYVRHRDTSSRPLLIGGREDYYTQVHWIDSDGNSAVEKFGFKLQRSRFSFTGSVIQVN